jgi:hypothetical protein
METNMYSRYDYHHHIPFALSRHAILERAVDADPKHPVRHWILEAAVLLAPFAAVGIVIAALVV